MSSCRSSGEDYAANRLRRIQQDINHGDFMNWATDEEIAARKAELERNVREEVRRTASRQPGGRAENPRPGNTTFVGSINPQRAYSHNVPGTVPQQQDPHIAPLMSEAHRVADQFCEQFCCLKAEVAILEAENLELRRHLQYFLKPLSVVPPSPPGE